MSDDRLWKVAVAALAAALFVIVIPIGGASAAAPSAQDRSFAAASAQTNLAEITIGKIALRRSHSAAVTALAHKTMSDHRTAQQKLTAAAKATGITLPSKPNATQQAQATQLNSVAAGSFDVTYLNIQVAGHQQAIAATPSSRCGSSAFAQHGVAQLGAVPTLAVPPVQGLDRGVPE